MPDKGHRSGGRRIAPVGLEEGSSRRERQKIERKRRSIVTLVGTVCVVIAAATVVLVLNPFSGDEGETPEPEENGAEAPDIPPGPSTDQLAEEYYEKVMELFDDAGFSPKVSHRTVHATTIYRLVENGFGLSIVPTSLQMGYQLGVKFIELTNIPQRTTLSAVWRADNENPALENFVLPGGALAAAHLHVARTVCRRAERLLVSLAREEAVREAPLIYLNRLSDALFVMARYENDASGMPDVLWDSRA